MLKLKEKSNENKTTTTKKHNAQIILNAGEDLEHVNICAFLVGMQNWDSFSEGLWFIIKLITHLQLL